ncbi:MAG: DUF1631 family protein, partial [Pseudomonadota bacterium]
MSLSPRQLPFTRSLLDMVVAEFGADAPAASSPLDKEELIRFLGRSKDTDASPLATIKRRAAKQNRTAELTPEDHAVLAWVCEAFSDWEERYPLELPLREQLRRLLPLAVAMAMHDDEFLFPGAHPLHLLLDSLQAGAVGWQVRLDRAGQMLEQRIERSVDKALEWFENQRVDIESITRELTAANERDAARAQRMVQRLEETELARLRKETALRDAALFINRGLQEFELPSAIGEFLKGPWRDSAQMILVKFGKDSDEWAQMRRTTRHLMESVQDRSDISEAQGDRLEQMLRRLPSELRRWLISLEHDSDETDGAIGLVEYAHLRLQHGQDIERSLIDPLEVEEQGASERDDDELRSQTGEWYQFEDDDGELRAQLVLQLENNSHLLFANFVGLKALDLRRQTFAQRLEDGFAHHLPHRASFSLSLAAAVGIKDDDQYRAFHDPDYRPPAQKAETPAEDARADEDSKRSIGAGSEPDTSEAQTWDSNLPPLGGSASSESSAGVESPEPEKDPAPASPQKPEIDPIQGVFYFGFGFGFGFG